MRILIVSYYFPPYNAVGALRVGKMAKYLHSFGHDVRVVTARNQPLQRTIKLELPEDQAIYTNWLNVNRIIELAFGGRKKVISKGYDLPSGISYGLLKRAGLLYKSVTNIPDGQIGWYPYAIRKTLDLCKSWRPDIIYASASPYTSLLVASKISHNLDIPWLADLRDLWVDNQNYPFGNTRRKLDTWLEKKVLGSAAGMVTVSEPLAKTIIEKYGMPIETILNGYDLDDYPVRDTNSLSKSLEIVYTGMVYEGKQDPTPMFTALKLLGQEATEIRLSFFGRYLGTISRMIREYGLENIVSVNDVVSHEKSLSIQKNADILLLLLWQDIKQEGIYTAKIFEYIGAKRPILAIGNNHCVAAQLLEERKIGYVSDDPCNIAQYLRSMMLMKNRHGGIGNISQGAIVGFSREEQAAKLDHFMRCLVNTE